MHLRQVHHAFHFLLGASLTKTDARKALELLADANATRREALDAYPSEPIHHVHDEDTESYSPIIDVFGGLDGE